MVVYTLEQRLLRRYVNKQNCRIWGTPACIHWKTDAPKTSRCLVRILVQSHNWAIFLRKISKKTPLQSMAIVIGPCWMNFYSQKLKRRILATFGFKRTTLRATQPSMFCALFLKIVLSAGAIWHRWTIICVTPISQRQLTL